MVEPIAGVLAGGMTVFFVLMILGLGRLMDGRSKDRRPSLVIEGDDGRLTFTGTQFDKKNMEWIRDYLRHELAGDPPPAAAQDRQERSVRFG